MGYRDIPRTRRAWVPVAVIARCPFRFAVLTWLATGIALAQPIASVALGPDIIDLLDAPPAARALPSPDDRHLLLVHSRQLLPLERLAEPAVEVAGRFVNPSTAAPRAPIEYFGLTLVDLATGESQPVALPRGAVIGYPEWSPDGAQFAFTLTRPRRQMELWVGNPSEARVRPLAGGISGVLGAACGFMPDGGALLCKKVAGKLDVRDAGSVAGTTFSAAIAASMAAISPQPLDAGLVSGLLEAQLELVDSDTGASLPIGEPAALDHVSPAPAGAYLLVERVTPPYPRYMAVDPITTVNEVWDRFGNVVARIPANARSVAWNASRPAELVWVEQRGEVDRIVSLRAPFDAEPGERFVLARRFAGLRWIGDRDAALVSDHDAATRATTLWYVPMSAGDSPRILASHSSTAPRIPLMRNNAHGVAVVAEQDGSILFRGHELVADRREIFLERVELQDGANSRIWHAPDDGRQELVGVLGESRDYLLVRHESPSSPPNYVVSRRDGRGDWNVTNAVHPAPALADAERRRLEYRRYDGTELSASLYLPPGRRRGERLPLIVWAYPQRILAGSNARLPDTTDRFPTFERAFRHYFLLRGYAILDDVSMPVVGDDATANDTFIDQIVADAEAAVTAARETGLIDPERIGVAGHSYGAFMVANLLAHSRLFGAGVALSGAYNRTLTPFGFQTERRTLWDAPDTYIAMSPILFADRIEAPLLLVHGLLDDNSGTAPIQSTQFFQAIRGNGGVAELLLLPWEGHAYRGRESVLTTAAGMLDWFDRYLQPKLSQARLEDTGALLRP